MVTPKCNLNLTLASAPSDIVQHRDDLDASTQYKLLMHALRSEAETCEDNSSLEQLCYSNTLAHARNGAQFLFASCETDGGVLGADFRREVDELSPVRRERFYHLSQDPWCFELDDKERVEWIVRECLQEEWCDGLDSFLRMTCDKSGFVYPNGVRLHIGMHEVKEYLAAWGQQEIRRELEKWGPNEMKSSSSSGASSSKRKCGRLRGLKKKR
ncbi:hypothetical protein SUGI_1142800 [Cryptomeria japonica]|nr:hypothetical protein SUGI_1142800 [Cryptomeria japonica]